MWQLVSKRNSEIIYDEFYNQEAADYALSIYFQKTGNYDRMVINGG